MPTIRFITPQTIQYTFPLGCTPATIRAWGAGGSGGSGNASWGGGGGGGGAYVEVRDVYLSLVRLTITVPPDALIGTDGNSGFDGGNAQVYYTDGNVLICNAAGGKGGKGGNQTATGADTSGAGGQIADSDGQWRRSGGAGTNSVFAIPPGNPANRFLGGYGGGAGRLNGSPEVRYAVDGIQIADGSPQSGDSGAGGWGGSFGGDGALFGSGGGGSNRFLAGPPLRASGAGRQGLVTVTWGNPNGVAPAAFGPTVPAPGTIGGRIPLMPVIRTF